ncbi:MAG: hypothetical protein Q9162_005568 [Coniocarpon cinnabarinum]
MPAPTALLRAPEHLAEEEASTALGSNDQPIDTGPVAATAADATAPTEAPTISTDTLPDAPPLDENASQPAPMQIDADGRPQFAPEAKSRPRIRTETRKVLVPPHRMTPLKSMWPKIYPPLVQHLKLQVRMVPQKKTIELRTSRYTVDNASLQKGEDFCKAFCLGFDVDDAIALLRLDDLYIETFEIKDVKMLSGEHLGRAIGRIAGKDGKTKFAIENATRTRVSLEGQTVHILGGFKEIHMAREAVVSLILGSPPGKVYGNLRTVSARMKERF